MLQVHTSKKQPPKLHPQHSECQTPFFPQTFRLSKQQKSFPAQTEPVDSLEVSLPHQGAAATRQSLGQRGTQSSLAVEL